MIAGQKRIPALRRDLLLRPLSAGKHATGFEMATQSVEKPLHTLPARS